MNRKMFVIFATLLMVLSSFVILPFDSNVNANPGDDDNEDPNIDFEIIYNTTYELSRIISRDDIYPNGVLKKGRAFGTDGEHDAADYLKNQLIINCSFSENDVSKVQLGPIQEAPGSTIQIVEKVLLRWKLDNIINRLSKII